MLARVFVIVGGLIVVALTAALVVPYFIDWSTYRTSFEREASAVLGREVKVNGAATARLLPFPSVTFTDVTVAGIDGKNVAMTVEEFSMDAELAPFLSGDVLIFDMRLVRPRAVVNIDDSGRVDWVLRPNTPFDPKNITLEDVSVTDGEVRVRTAGGAERQFTQINTAVTAQSLAGPWRADGTLRLDGREATVAVSTGIVDSEGLRLKIKVEPVDVAMSTELDGVVSSSEGALRYKGKFHVAERLAAPKADRDGNTEEQVQAAGNRASGRFEMDDRQFVVDEFRFESGPANDPYVANGSASIQFGGSPQFAIKATGQQIFLNDGGDGLGNARLADRISALSEALARVPVPGIPGTVDLKLPAIVTGDTTIRDVTLEAATAPGGWDVQKLTAVFPGRTTLEAKGALVARPALDFKGHLLVAVGQPSGFVGWLASDIDAPVRRLSKAGIDANVELSANRLALKDVELILGNAKFAGSIERVDGQGAKPRISVDLIGAATSADEASALASFFIDGKGDTRLGDYDVSLKLKAGPVGDAPLRADTADIALRLSGQRLEVDRFSIVGVAGASVAATARIDQIDRSPKVTLDATLLGDDLAPFVELMNSRARNPLTNWLALSAKSYTGLLKGARIDIVGDGEMRDASKGDLRISAKGALGETSLDASLNASGQLSELAAADIDLKAKLSARDGGALLALAGAPVLPLGLVGPAEFELASKGNAAAGMDASFNLKSRQGTGSFKGLVSSAADGLRVKGTAVLDASDIEPWLMTTGFSVPGLGTGMSANVKANVEFSKGLLILNGLDGTMAGGKVSGDLSVETREGLPVVSGALDLGQLDLGQFALSVLGPDVLADNSGQWSSIPFQPTNNAPLRAKIDVTTSTLVFGSLEAQNAALLLQVDDSGLKASDIRAQLEGGSLSAMFELKNSAATGLFSGQFKLSGAQLQSLFQKLGLSGADASGKLDMSASLTASGRSISAMVSSLSGTGTAKIGGASINGLDPAAFGQLIRAVDDLGHDVEAIRKSEIAPEIVQKGLFRADSAEVAYTVAGGVARIPAIVFERPDSTLNGELKLDFNQLTVQGKGSLIYKPGEEALVGSDPQVDLILSGTLGSPALSIDAQPLTHFLIQRALEIEQVRVEGMQDNMMEKQRLRREAKHFATIESERKRAIEEQKQREEEEARQAEEARLKAEAEVRRKLEEEAARKLAEEARIKAEKEAAIQAEEERLRAEAEARRLAEEEAARKVAEEARLRAAEEAARKAEAERLKAEAEARRIAEEEAARKAAEEERLKAEAEARRLAEEQAARKAAEEKRLAAEAEARRIAEEEAARKLAEQERVKAEAEARRLAAEAAALKAAEEARLKAELEARKIAEEKRLAAEAEARQLADQEAARKAAEEKRLQAEAAARQKAEEEAARKAAEVARLKAELEARRIAEEKRVAAEAEAERKAAEEEKKRIAQEEADRKAAEAARIKAEAEARRVAEEAQRKAVAEAEARRAEEEARLKAEEQARLAAEAARLKAEAEARLEAEKEAARKAKELARLKAEMEAARESEQQRLAAEAEARRKAEEELARKAEEEARLKAELEAAQKAEEERLKAEPITPDQGPIPGGRPVAVEAEQPKAVSEPAPAEQPAKEQPKRTAKPVQQKAPPRAPVRRNAPANGDFPPAPEPSRVQQFLRSLQ
ncbi:MAG: AsmA family protein [Rhizobiaceae bacterium]|nr:AsmA family protein [Rhizobiaceae bacterium]